MTDQNLTQDVFEAMDEAKAPSQHVFGINFFDSYFCVLQKGVYPPAPYDPQVHSPEQRRTFVTVTINPLTGQYNTERKLVAESKEWTNYILASIKALGLSVRDLNGKYVHAELVESGSYTDKNGEKKTKTMPKYLAVYKNQEECEAAAKAFFGNGHSEELDTEQTANKNGTNQDALKAFIDIYVKKAGGNLEELAKSLEADTVLKGQGITIDHPLVQELLNVPF